MLLRRLSHGFARGWELSTARLLETHTTSAKAIEGARLAQKLEGLIIGTGRCMFENFMAFGGNRLRSSMRASTTTTLENGALASAPIPERGAFAALAAAGLAACCWGARRNRQK